MNDSDIAQFLYCAGSFFCGFLGGLRFHHVLARKKKDLHEKQIARIEAEQLEQKQKIKNDLDKRLSENNLAGVADLVSELLSNYNLPKN